MKRILTQCFAPLFCLLTFASCQGDCPACGRPAASVDLTGRLYPKVKTPTKSLVVVDLQNDDIEGQVAAIGLQGIVNRESEQKIYVMNSRCKDNHGGWKTGPHDMAQMGQFWLDRVLQDIPQETLTLDAMKSNPAFSALVEHYKKYIKGVVIYDPALIEATIEAATTIAGQTDALIVSPRLYEEVKKYGFPVIQDLRGRFKSNIECVDWLVENYFETANRDVAFTWSHMTTDFQESWGAANKDYVVANRLFTYFLDIQDHEECAYYENIVKKYPAGTQIMGWTDELKADKLFADYGYFMVPFISVENMTVMSSFPSVKGTPLKPQVYEAEPNTVYIALLVSDGDNLLHTMIYMPYTIEESAAYGEVPVTWIINPAIVDLAPRVFNWYERVMNAGGQEMGAMMGDGSPTTDRYSGFSFYCSLTKHYLEQAGMLTMKQMVDGEAVAWNVQPYCLEGGYAGTDWRGIGSTEYHMDNECFHVGTTNSRPEYLNEVLNTASVDEPLFLSVMIGTASEDVLTYAAELKKQIEARNDGRKYVFVRTADLAATYRAYKGLPTE
ncbi:GxGYxYP domain-containing protein [uncultured Alistipes sp.]|uniref:GxGYxYP domain-containing protein n=1 Tax=uncultured Alistipes sp. TaxID=538949 RepID=UPI0025EAE7BA|nr:GxGYxYP domain-containing protein [uncultured Alistipes sp.]